MYCSPWLTSFKAQSEWKLFSASSIFFSRYNSDLDSSTILSVSVSTGGEKGIKSFDLMVNLFPKPVSPFML